MLGMSEPSPRSWTDRLRQLRDALLHGLVERDEPIRLALLAALAGEHLLLLGDPGTAKSLVARRLHLACKSRSYFERLLTRFTVPEELFGPLSIKGLEQDRYERLVDGYLPSATVAFLDEVFKANSAILNALLTLLNEREFDNGTRRLQTPLAAVIGASNELPKGDELGALYDRFLLRLQVAPVSKEGFRSLLQLRGQAAPTIAEGLQLSPEELAAIRTEAESVEVPGDVEALLAELREWCAAEKVLVSDRRWRKIIKLLQVAALTNGRTAVSVWDCWLLQHCVWEKPDERTKVHAWYSERVGTSKAMDPTRLTQVVVSWEGQLQRDKKGQSQVQDEQGRLVYQGADGKPTIEPRGEVQKRRGNEPLFLAPDKASTQNYDYHFSQYLVERTNAGKGYTASELDGLYVRPHNQIVTFGSWRGREAYLGDSSNWVKGNEEFVRLMEPTRHKDQYVTDVLRQVDELLGNVHDYADQLAEHVESLETQIRSHLWVMPDFAGVARATLEQTQRSVGELVERVLRVREGFDKLPREHERAAKATVAAPTPAPAPASASKRKKVEASAEMGVNEKLL